MILTIDSSKIINFDEFENYRFQELLNVFNYHAIKNEQKEKYYEGKISLGSVNLGIALPDGISKLEIGCSWGAKTIDVLAGKSKFDGFVGLNGLDATELNEIVQENNLIAEYDKACRDQLKFGCTFATLSRDEKGKTKIRFHSPKTAAALWNGAQNRIDCGFAIIDTVPDESKENTWIPSLIYYYTDDSVWELRLINGFWYASRNAHKMGRPLMFAFIWNSTSNKPFGRSRLKEPIRNLIDGFVRTVANAAIALEFSTAPQKYLLGVTDQQFDAVVSNKFKQYVGNIIAATTNPDTGNNPVFGQLPQGNISPHIEMLRILAVQFAAATGLSVTDTGVINDANPTSADAVIAQTETLIGMAEQLNTMNGNTLNLIGVMALAMEKNIPMEQLSDDEKGIIAHFKNPAMVSVSQTADAAVKIASVRPNFAGTDTFLEMIGFDSAEVRRIKAQEQRAAGFATLQEMGIE